MSLGRNLVGKVTEEEHETIKRAAEARGVPVGEYLRQVVEADLQESRTTGGRPVTYRQYPPRTRFLSTRLSDQQHEDVRKLVDEQGTNRSKYLADRALRAARAVLEDR